MKHVWVVLQKPEYDEAGVLGVYERLQDAEEDWIPEEAEVERAEDWCMIYSTDQSRWIISDYMVVELGDSIFS